MITSHELGKVSVETTGHFYLYSKSISQLVITLLRSFLSIAVLFYINLVLSQFIL